MLVRSRAAGSLKTGMHQKACQCERNRDRSDDSATPHLDVLCCRASLSTNCFHRWDCMDCGVMSTPGRSIQVNMHRRADMRTAWGFVQQSLAVALILSCLLSHVHGQAQMPGQLAEFEVASIKPNKSNERIYYGLRNSSLTVRNMTVQGLIQAAYGKRDFQISGGPAWIGFRMFRYRGEGGTSATGHAGYVEVAAVEQVSFVASSRDQRDFRLFAGYRSGRAQDEIVR